MADLADITVDQVKLPGEVDAPKDEKVDDKNLPVNDDVNKDTDDKDQSIETDKVDVPPVDDQPTDDYTEEELEAFNTISQETGVEVSSDEDILKALVELDGYRKGNYPGVSPALKKAIEIERNGGDLAAYFRSQSLNPEQLDDREMLRLEFLDKDSVSKRNPKLASMNFEREYKNRYGVYFQYQSLKDEAEKAEFYEKNSGEIEYQKERYADDVAQARKSMQDLKENFPITRPGGLTEQQERELAIKHENDQSQAIKGFKPVELSLGDDEKFAIGLDSTTRPIVTRWVRDPRAFLKDIGFDGESNSIDYDRLMRVATVIANVSVPGFGERLKKAVLDGKNIKTIENELTGARRIDRSGGNPPDSKDIWDKVGEAFEKKRS